MSTKLPINSIIVTLYFINHIHRDMGDISYKILNFLVVWTPNQNHEARIMAKDSIIFIINNMFD